jgi:peptidoglycan/LPS O-acetylase OafA/YrhL
LGIQPFSLWDKILPDPSEHDRLQWVDALRGYAIFFVLSYHVYQVIPNINLKVQRILDLGSTGVQLFFMVSAFTIFLTLDKSKHLGFPAFRAFFIRRAFRIMPLFYLTLFINAFFLNEQTGAPFPLKEFLASLTFASAWIPTLCPTMVPGGWSIAVEMWFYLLSPLLIYCVKTLRQACYFVLIAVLFRFIINESLTVLIVSKSNLFPTFLFFWLPNQAPLFALGILIFFLYKKWNAPLLQNSEFISAKHPESYAVFFLLTGGYLLVASTFAFKAMLPYHFLFGIAFLLIIQFMILKPNNLLVSAPLIGLGKISYSAYITHFFVIRFTSIWFFKTIQTVTASPELQFMALLVWTLVLTVLASMLLYRAVEQPGQNLGKKLIRRLSTGSPRPPTL